VLQNNTAGVLGLGGGGWITDENRALVRQYNGVSVWLDTPFEVCWQRITSSSEDRPLGRTRGEAEQRFRLRRPIYQSATIRLPALAHERPAELVARLGIDLAKLWK